MRYLITGLRLIEYLHEKAGYKSEVTTRTLPPMGNVAERLNTFYSKRYMANKTN